MAYATQGIEDMYANGLASIVSPELAGAMLILFFIGIIFLRNLPTTAKLVIGVPALFIGFAMIASTSFTALLVLGFGMLFVYALWRMFGNR